MTRKRSRMVALLAAVCVTAGSVSLRTNLPVSLSVSADTLAARSISDIEQEKKEKQAEIERKQAELDALAKDISDQDAYVQALEEQIALINSKMLLIDTELNRLRAELDRNEAEIAELEVQTAEQEAAVEKGLEDFKTRIRTLYVHGNDSLLSALVGATDFYDVLAKIDLLQRIGKHDDEMLKNLRAQLNELEDTRQALTLSRSELTIREAENEAAREEFNASREELDAASETAERLAQELAAQRGEVQEDLYDAEGVLKLLEQEEEEIMLEAAKRAAEALQRKQEESRMASELAAQQTTTTYTTTVTTTTEKPAVTTAPPVTTAPVVTTAPASSSSVTTSTAAAVTTTTATTASTAKSTTTATGKTTTTSATKPTTTTSKTTTTTTAKTTTTTTTKVTTTTTTTTTKPVTTTAPAATQPSTGKSTFAWPVPGFYHISSGFGLRFNGTSFHKGIDIAGAGIHYQPAKAAESGEVIKSKGGCTHDNATACKCNGGYGNYVEVLHDNGMITLYAHLAEIKVTAGQKVALGDTLGLIGATGNVVSSGGGGYHLHFGVIVNGEFVDPKPYLGL